LKLRKASALNSLAGKSPFKTTGTNASPQFDMRASRAINERSSARRQRRHLCCDEVVAVSTEELRLGIGGPFHRLERAARVERMRRLLPLLIAVTWAPLCVFALVQWATRGTADSLIRDLSVHARLLVAIPVIVSAERLLDQIARVAIARIFDEELVPAASAPRVRAMLRAVERWRDAAWPESLMLVAAFVAGVAALVGWIPAGGVVSGAGTYRYDAVRLWYGLASLPIFQFLLWRSLFRFALWLRVLAGLARTPLALVATHADTHGGIAFLRMPSVVYGALLLFATSAVLCASWATQIAMRGLPLATFRLPFLVFVVLGVVVVLAPLLMFTPQLWKVRVVGLRRYGGLVTDYVRRFQARWIEGDRASLLGTSDIQSLADITSAYQNSVAVVGTMLFGKRDAVVVAAAALLPAVPLLFLEGPAHEVVKRVAGLLLGAMP
jgi:hypothetical protein